MTRVPYQLRDNGAEDPNRWDPSLDNRRERGGEARVQVGDLWAWRYSAWRVHKIIVYRDVDLTDEQRAKYEKLVAATRKDGNERQRCWPYHLIVRHERGPIVYLPGEKPWKRLRDGSNTIELSFTVWPSVYSLTRLIEPYKVCSCHGHPWPCQEMDRQALADYRMAEFRKLEASHAAGMCASCREPISTAQKVLTFPEPSRMLPGAPGPSYHAGRSGCWAAAEEYERSGRLADNPDIVRLASCPGIRFIHEARDVPADRRVECTAGPLCTGHHGPPGLHHDKPCWLHVELAANEGAYARPSFDCGYRQPGVRECVGADLSGGGTSLSPIAADLIWAERRRQQKRYEDPGSDSDAGV